MVSGFICGTYNFPKEEDDYERHTRNANSSSRKSRSCKNRNNNNNKNPYSTLGLDKFSALLAEIEEKRQQIYSEAENPDEISLVRFEYAGDHDFKPIVVKIKPRRSLDHDRKQSRFDDEKPKKLSKLHSFSSMEVKGEKKGDMKEGDVKNIKKMELCRNLRICEWNESQFYLIIIVVLVLGILVLFGRSFAIFCTSIGWYVIPTITKNVNSSSNFKVYFKKKDYAIRKFSVKEVNSFVSK